MYGVVASQGIASSPVEPGDTLASVDFVSGIYTVGGVSLTAADVVGDTGRISSGGLSITASPVNLLGAFRDALWTANWTAVVEFEVLHESEWPGHLITFLLVQNADLHGAELYTGFLYPSLNDIDEVGAHRKASDDDNPADVGVNKIACTRTNDRVALSLNGLPFVANFTPLVAPTPYTVARTAWHNGSIHPAGYVRSIAIYAPVPNTELPALSSLPTP